MAIEPITRKEKFLAKAGGQSVEELKPITREEMFLSKIVGGGSGGGNADWNASEGEEGYVKNRTHYVETIVVNEPLNITWDGNTEGLVSADVYYKISDAILTDEQIKTITEINNNGGQYVVSDNWDTLLSYGDVTPDLVATSDCIYVRKAGVEFYGMSFPEPGIYAVSNGGYYIASITTTEPVEYPKVVVKKLDKKFLPDIIFTRSPSPAGYVFTCNTPYNKVIDMIASGIIPKMLDIRYEDDGRARHVISPLFRSAEMYRNRGYIDIEFYDVVGMSDFSYHMVYREDGTIN